MKELTLPPPPPPPPPNENMDIGKKRGKVEDNSRQKISQNGNLDRNKELRMIKKKKTEG